MNKLYDIAKDKTSQLGNTKETEGALLIRELFEMNSVEEL